MGLVVPKLSTGSYNIGFSGRSRDGRTEAGSSFTQSHFERQKTTPWEDSVLSCSGQLQDSDRPG